MKTFLIALTLMASAVSIQVHAQEQEEAPQVKAKKILVSKKLEELQDDQETPNDDDADF